MYPSLRLVGDAQDLAFRLENAVFQVTEASSVRIENGLLDTWGHVVGFAYYRRRDFSWYRSFPLYPYLSFRKEDGTASR